MKSYSLLRTLGLVAGLSLTSAFAGNDLFAQRHHPSKQSISHLPYVRTSTYKEDELGRTIEKIVEYNGVKNDALIRRDVTIYYYDNNGFQFREETLIDEDGDGVDEQFVDITRGYFSNEFVELTQFFDADHEFVCAKQKVLENPYDVHGETHYKSGYILYDRDGDGVFEDSVPCRD